MKKSRYLRTSEHQEAVRSLEWAELQARSLRDDPYQWKWVLSALHSAAQGFMVLALWQGNGLLTLSEKDAKKWCEAHNKGENYPEDRLDSFLNLYRKIKSPECFTHLGENSFVQHGQHDKSFELLNELRNKFTHFTPKGWSLELAGLPDVCLDVLDMVQFFGWDSRCILWHLRRHPICAKRAVQRLRRTMNILKSDYQN